MLLINGVLAIVVGAALIAAARLVAADGMTPTAALRRILGSRATDSAAVLLMCVGGLTLLIFLADWDTQPALLMQGGVAAVLAVGGTLGIRSMLRRAGPPKAAAPSAIDEAADRPTPAADQPKRAA